MLKFAVCLSVVLLTAHGLAEATPAQAVPFEPERWDIQARESKVIDHLGREAFI